MEQVIRMKYKAYKEHYADCETVYGSYEKGNKSIEVIVPEGRIKKSGVRGKNFHYYTFKGVDNVTGRSVRTTIKAVSVENARKYLDQNCTWEQ